MAVIPTNALRPRGDNSGRTFSIIFAVVAFIVVFGCVVWGIVLPKYRKRRDTHPLGARYMVTPSYPPFSPPPRFPSHPALLRNFRKQPPNPVQHYDPRTESPFPNSLAQLNAIYRPLQVGSSNTAGLSYGPFTPAQCWLSTRLQPQHMPQGNLQRARKGAGTDPRNFTTFKGKHDYILPVPEPVVLKPRPAGRPPPLTRQLERFPIPLGSGRKGGLVHPVKLFQELEQRSSMSTTDTFGTPCPTTQSTTHLTDTEMSVMKLPAECKTPPGRPQRELLKLVECKTHNSLQRRRLPITRILPINRDEAGTPQTTKTEKQEGLERMGTLTRPKTPVAEIRDWFDRAASAANKDKVSSKPYTPSTNPFTTPRATSTPATSPTQSTKKSRSLATSSRPQGAAPCINVPSHAHRRTPSSVILPSPEKLNTLRHARPSKRPCQAAKGSPAKIFKRRSISGRAKLASWSQLRPNKRISRRYSSSSLSTIFKPILTPRSKHSLCTSSIYSRDMRGLSPTGGPDRQGGDAESNDRVELPSGKGADLARNISASIDHVKSKIDNWDLHTGHLDASVMPQCVIKRSISDSGLRRSTLRNCEDRPASRQETGEFSHQGPGKSIPLIQIGRPSDDVFGIEADGFQAHEAGKLMKRIGNFEAAPIILGGLGHGTAPGGGDWI
ncbi:uncharacterized protein A1O5_12756 [Cladophialophora psammophila CBS 110553]|uniref:Uncharacterized protein n=1 Tax=Cladophialophora psammophila CBS 110553 TaxID=1182543 RepID=W9VH91_9EURO|nr:uncharacterized protein A1O5_12756 [Cladophialophora psammophila CBS 110553]EXJ55017.1 hypothetical protein A1O5_12756 [Cladophialophora psammophila CBS 110553]